MLSNLFFFSMSTSSSTTSSSTSAIPFSTQAINVAIIKTHIPITLDLQSSNYSKWRTLFLGTLGKYGLTHHVDGTDPKHDDSERIQQDFIVLSWLYGSISMEIFDIVMQGDATTYAIWTNIENMYRDNKKSRAIFLEAEFRNLARVTCQS